MQRKLRKSTMAPAVIVLIISIVMTVNAESSGARMNALQEYLSPIIFSDDTLSQYANEFEVSAKRSIYTINKPGNAAYFTSGSESGLPGFYPDISGIEFSGSGTYFFSFDSLVIRGKKYWVSMKFDYDLPYSVEKDTVKDLESAFGMFLKTFSEERTEENLRFCADKYLSKFILGPNTKKTVISLGGEYIQPSKNEKDSSAYAFTGSGAFLNVSSSLSEKEGNDLSECRFPEQVAAIRINNSQIGGTDYWIIVNYSKKANRASTPTEVESALDQIEIVFEKEEARESGATEEEIHKIGITTIRSDYGDSGSYSSKKDSGPAYSHDPLRPLSGDPLELSTKDIISDLSDDKRNSSLKSLAADFYSLVKTTGGVAFVVSFFAGMILLSLYGAKVKDAVASSLFSKAVIVVIIIGFVSLFSLIVRFLLNIAGI